MGDRPVDVATPSLRALVVDADPARRARIGDALLSAGLEIVVADDTDAADVVDVVVLDAGVASPADILRHRAARPAGPGGPAPVLFLADDVAALDHDALADLAGADCAVRPVSDDELLHRVRMLVAAARRRGSQQATAETLRTSVREVVGRIWGLHDPRSIAVETVRGAAAALGVDLACLITFDDARVPRLVVSSRAPDPPVADGDPSARPAPAASGSGPSAFDVATSLWSTESVLAPGQESAEHTVALRGVASMLPQVTEGSWLVVPFGQGRTPLGLLCLGADDPHRTWSSLERSLTQHVAANLAPALMQGHLITVQQQVVERMRQLDQERDSMIATVNHELRTPLTSIIAYLELVRDGEGGELPDEAAEMLTVVERNAARLRSLIDDAMTLSQKHSPHDRVREPSPVDLAALLRAVIASLWPIASARGVGITIEADATEAEPGAPEDPFVVVGDEGELERVFTNILGNAVKFSPDDRQVDVSIVRRTDGDAADIAVVVSDRGVGIPEDEISRLFTRFYRASNATRAAVPGTGLGLAIAREIVVRHSGAIDLESTLGAGTTVTVTLPALRTGARTVRLS
jgi:two-component system phosphate regulon sensor histidine kinase PhoR